MAMKPAIAVLLLWAASSRPHVDLRPLQRVTVLPMGQCDVEVTFRLSVADGGSEKYYCPRIVWEWEDGTFTSEQSDCPPIDQATPDDHQRSWTRSRAFQGKGSYPVRAHLCQGRQRVATVETAAVIAGWDGYPARERQEAGCSPARARPISTPATPRAVDQGMLPAGAEPDERETQATRSGPAREPCSWTAPS